MASGILARHQRSYDKGAQIESATHVQDLVEQKRAARQHRATDQLARAAPASQKLLTLAAGRGHGLASITAELMQLLDRYGAAELQAAILEALSRDVPHPNAVRIARLDRRREEQHQPAAGRRQPVQAGAGTRRDRQAAPARTL
jgi:hypothetical protein